MIAASAVHTTGVNIQGLLANVVSITIIIGALGALLLKQINRSIEDKIRAIVTSALAEIRTVIDDQQSVIDQHGRDISYLKGMQEGKRMALDELTQAAKT